ncbi:helix-turn-helix domain-containing protein [Pseudonocardia sp. KRD-184]|uniref:Helix-turn-helix domain-containing protein n=1 Tax=Pseudonocardia oceani TaxID=2792013 RepID=A0ABS6UAL2_9PSEU|nr:PucR family transcriptional regulator [Pseudonocardia oceani]MBW0088916.1 helix-turn-helix domain-containing protein [Pseudonocardia oceani]MBW0096097.1 helix-turn-helix domain-containing protein [Pseudonocardia oceani]MBW0108865.1 helix-turn-helix domain-containing protein [Pseudonocardia oceani]MBW0122693.1 helix-turn-helix domain-containing protein [Pseudonocardia oceani]MBW0129271.1 helix-turn-helix domain-containing protein [Pseudonocardia oceani]
MSTLESIIDLLTHRHPGAVEVLVGGTDRSVEDIRLVEQVDQVDDAPTNALVVLERGLAALTADYRFDIVVRRAAAREVAALVVVLPADVRVSLTALALARRAAICVIRLAPEVDLTAAVGTIVRQATDQLSVTVDRARAVSEAIDGRAFGDVDTLLDHVGLLLGRTIGLGPRPEDDDVLAVPAGAADSWLRTTRPDDADAGALLEMVLWRIAAETTRLSADRARAEQVSRRSAGEVLVQLVAADRPARAAIAPSARRLGIPIDGWHVMTRIEPDNLLEVAGDDVVAYEIRDDLAALALQAAASMPGTWHVGPDPAAVLLMWTGSDAPCQETHARLRRQLDFVIRAMTGRVRGLRLFCGTGSARPGVAGLASSATEARLAVSSARFRRRSNTPVYFDAVGMRATLLEWYGSPTVQQSIDQLFAPVADLAPAKRQAMIDTLCTYLDFQGSAARAAEVLHLHRNAVRYRVQRAFELLGIEEDDADQRLFLHLACRAQRLGEVSV